MYNSYVEMFLNEASVLDQEDLGYVAESVNVQCFDEDTFIVEANDVFNFINSNDIDSIEEALAMIAEANDIDVMPIFAISEADIVDAINYADMGDTSLLEDYHDIIAECVDSEIPMCMISLDEEGQAPPPNPAVDQNTNNGGILPRIHDKFKKAGNYVKAHPGKSATMLLGGAAVVAGGKYAYNKYIKK